MKNKVKKELRQKSKTELVKDLTTKRDDLKKAYVYRLDERNKNKTKNLRKEIAIIATFIKEKGDK